MATADGWPGVRTDDNRGVLDTTTDADGWTVDEDETNGWAGDSTEEDDESVDASSARTWARTRRNN